MQISLACGTLNVASSQKNGEVVVHEVKLCYATRWSPTSFKWGEITPYKYGFKVTMFKAICRGYNSIYNLWRGPPYNFMGGSRIAGFPVT